MSFHCFASNLLKVSSLLPLNFGGDFPGTAGERALIPEDQVIGELADGVVAFAVCPVSLLGREVRNRDIAADEPVALVMGAV